MQDRTILNLICSHYKRTKDEYFDGIFERIINCNKLVSVLFSLSFLPNPGFHEWRSMNVTGSNSALVWKQLRRHFFFDANIRPNSFSHKINMFSPVSYISANDYFRWFCWGAKSSANAYVYRVAGKSKALYGRFYRLRVEQSSAKLSFWHRRNNIYRPSTRLAAHLEMASEADCHLTG